MGHSLCILAGSRTSNVPGGITYCSLDAPYAQALTAACQPHPRNDNARGGRPLGSGRQLPPQLTVGRRPLGGGGGGSWRPRTRGVAPPGDNAFAKRS